MYRNQKNKRNLPAVKPVFVSRKRNDLEVEKENQATNDNDEIPASQDILSSQGIPGIPASQNASQARFASQRHQIRLTQGQQQARGKNYFEIALISAKVVASEIACELIHEGDDPISFTRRFRSILCSGSIHNNENIRKFLEGFREMFSLQDDSKISQSQKFLLGLVMKEGQLRHQSQTSLIQCFFAVTSLRDEISKILLETLKGYVVERQEHADPFIIGLIVAQFKFSDQFLTPDSYSLMYEKFFEILTDTTNDACREVIISNFRDFDEFKQNDAVKRLMTMYEDNIELLTPFIETFTEMCISDDTKHRISSLVQHLLESGCEAKLYPGIVKFLLYYSKDANIVINNIREHLNWNTSSSSIRYKVVQLLEKTIRRQESKTADLWIKTVANLEKSENLMLLDFVMLLAIVNVKEEKLPAIKKIFIQKVPAGFFNVDFLKEVFKTFPIIIAQYSDSLLELLNSLQKSNVFEINEFSSTCFIELFSNELSDKKEIIGSLVQFLCEKTPQLPFGPRSDFKVMTLNILNAMRKESLLIHYKILLRVLNYQKVQLTFDEHRLVMELLCSLAFTAEFNGNLSNIEKKKLEEERDALQEHLEMTMNKLMCNPDMKIKALGIIGAVKIVSALIVNIVMDSEDVGKTTKLSIDDLPAGQIKNAAKHVQFIIDAVRGNPHGFAMICDELSLGFKDGKVTYNELFMTWLSEKMFDRLDEVAGFQMSKELPENISYQLQVICSDFDEPDVAYKLGMLDNNEAIFIPSLFKLTRLLSQQINGNLRDCYIFSVMPLALPTNFEDNSKNKRSRLNLHFNCVNWLREIIGTYCHWNQDDKEALCEIVKQRLKQLVKVEKRLAMMLQRTPENFYPPPASFLDIENKKKSFDSLRREKKPPSKKSKKNLTVPEDDDEVNLDGINKFFREIDTQVIVLMMEKFKFSVETSGSDLGIEELHFLLEDVLNKISALCNPRASPGFYDPIKVIRDINATVIPSMVGIFEAIRGEFVSMSQKAEMDDVDNVFYTKDANILKNCFRLILELFTVIFTWRKLKLQKNKEVLLETLKTLVPEGDDKDVEQLASLIIEYCVEFEGNVKSIDCALALAKFLHAISKLTDSDIHQDFVAKTVENFLKKQWKNSKGDDDEGTTFNVCLEKLLEIYVETADFNKLEGFVDQMAEDFKFIANKQLSHQRSFSSFTKTNSIVMLRVYMSRLSQIIGSSLSTSYEFWRRCSAVFGKFEEITKGLGTAVAYLLFLKNFLVFMKGFNTQGVAALKLTVKNKTNFIAMVRSVQKLARFSHGLSCDLKHRKNKSISSILPKLREALTKHNQSIQPLIPIAGIPASAIFTGALKNYDAHCKEIWSQNTMVSGKDSDDDEDVEAEEPMEVEVDDETVGNLDLSVDDEMNHASFRSRSTIL